MTKQLTILKAENGFIVRGVPRSGPLVFPTLEELQKFQEEYFKEPEPEKP